MNCRVCGSSETIKFLDLGEQPLANRLLSQEDLSKQEPRYPLGLEYCPSCTFVQTTFVVPPDEMFLEYPYVTGTSSETRTHFKKMAQEVVERTGLPVGSTILDIGGNDGTLAQFLHYRGMRAINVEPAKNIAALAQRTHPDVITIPAFFNNLSSEAIARGYGKVDLITACNVFTHVPDPRQFLEDAKTLLKDDGTLVLEIYYLWDIVSNGAFDMCYHEHMSYFSLRTLRALVEQAGLEIWNVQHLDVQGGSLRVYVSRKGLRPVDDFVGRVARSEYDLIRAIERYEDFGDRVEEHRDEILRFLQDAKRTGQKVAGYAAAAKATVLCNYLGIGPEDVRYIVEDNPMKVGRYIPGVRIPIVGPAVLEKEPPSVLLIFSWNIAQDMVRKWKPQLPKTRFLVPLPELVEVG